MPRSEALKRAQAKYQKKSLAEKKLIAISLRFSRADYYLFLSYALHKNTKLPTLIREMLRDAIDRDQWTTPEGFTDTPAGDQSAINGPENDG